MPTSALLLALQVVMADAMGVAMRLKLSKAGEAAIVEQGSSGVRPRSRPGSAAARDPAAALLEGQSHHVVQAASDMWAVGVLAWECLAGRPLFDGLSDELVGVHA